MDRVGDGLCLRLFRTRLSLILAGQHSIGLSHTFDVELEGDHVTAGHLTHTRRHICFKRVSALSRAENVGSDSVSATSDTVAATVLS